MRPLQAHCHLALGDAYAQVNEFSKAHCELLAAAELYRVMSMPFWLSRAEASLARIGSKSSAWLSVSIHCVPPGPRFTEFTREEIEKSVPERFEKQVAQYPDHLAVKTKLHRFTYNEFNKFANRIARAITQRSGDNDAVALLLGHDSSAIVCIFGVLKAGRCFVPLDPLLPNF